MTDACTVRCLDKSNLAVGLVVANWPDGWPSKSPTALVTPITSMGVDYTRLRVTRYDYPMLRLTGLWSASDFEAAVNKQYEVNRMKGRTCSIAMTAAGKAYDWSKDFIFLIHEANAIPRAGQIFAAGVSGNAHLEVNLVVQVVPA